MKTRTKLSVYELCQIIAQITKFLENLESISEFLNKTDIHVEGLINPASLAVQIVKKEILEIYVKRKEEIVKLSDLIINPYDLEWVEQYYTAHDAELKSIGQRKEGYENLFTGIDNMKFNEEFNFPYTEKVKVTKLEEYDLSVDDHLSDI